MDRVEANKADINQVRSGRAGVPEPGYRDQDGRVEAPVESWQVVVAVFFVLLPLVLMLDFWGDERLTARGRPIRREWHRRVRPLERAGEEQERGGDDRGTATGQY